MLRSITLLLVCQLAGEVGVRALKVPVPGPVAGMMLLFAGLMLRGGIPPELDKVASALLSNLSLLFIPAGVGIVLHLHLLEREWLPIAAALVAGTLATIAVTGLVIRLLAPRGGEGRR